MVRTEPSFDAEFAARRIDADGMLRPPAPADVWNFHDYPSWRDEIWRLVDGFADQTVLDAIATNPPEYVLSDDMAWLESDILRVTGVSIDVFDRMMDALESRYRALRAVHGTRTADVGSFYREGLHPMDPLEMQQQARDLFLSPAYPELTARHLDDAIAAVGHENRAGRLYFDCNETGLVHRNGHYMLYGSEYQLAIAAHIEGERDYRQDMKRRGEPVVFLCDVPLSLLHPGSLRSFAGRAVEILFEELLGLGDGPSPTRDAGFCIRQTLTPDHIVGHYSPIVGRDAFAKAPWP